MPVHAIVAEGPGQLSWRDVPDAAAGPGEVLIKVAAAGVNRADLLQAAGLYPPPQGASATLGLEVSGVIAAVSDDVSDFEVGQQICALLTGGGYAQYVAGRGQPRRCGRTARGGLYGLVESGVERPPDTR